MTEYSAPKFTPKGEAVTGTCSTAVTATPAKAPTMKSAQMPSTAPLKVKNAFLVSMFGHALLSF